VAPLDDANGVVEVRLSDGKKKVVKPPPKKKNKKHKSVLQLKLGKLALYIGYIGKYSIFSNNQSKQKLY
jgi:hypothetical protein